jgi:hypothetical protein
MTCCAGACTTPLVTPTIEFNGACTTPLVTPTIEFNESDILQGVSPPPQQ